MMKAIVAEVEIIRSIKSKNIVEIYEAMESKNNYYLVQELCDSDLDKYIKTHKKIDEKEALDIFKQICSGCLAFVKEGIVHR